MKHINKVFALVFAFALAAQVHAQNLVEFRDNANVVQGNITDAATPVIEQMDLDGNATTSTALAANGTNCSAGRKG